MLLWVCTLLPAAASPYYGKVTFNGLAVPGATITATQGAKTFTTVTDGGGVYHFDDLKDGVWKIEVKMQLFSAIHAEVTVGPKTPPGDWVLEPLPMGELLAHTRQAAGGPGAPLTPSVAVVKNPEMQQSAQSGPVEIPKMPEEDEQSSDGFLVNGSQNNAATSQYSINPAFGNARSNGRALYNGGFATFVDNSALDARPFAVSGVEAPKNSYTHVTSALQIGGPLDIPHLMPHGPNFFAGYEWTRVNNAAINTGLVPTEAERSGDLSALPVTIYNPATGMPFTNNQVAVSAPAQALLNLYPAPNIAGVSAYNYQAPVLNSVHQDRMNSRLEKTLGRKDHLYGGFNFESTRSGSENLFGFVDKTDTLGMNANVHWMHRITPHFFVSAAYTFSRLRTQLMSNFENRENVSGAAGISGNDQDPSDWGPPGLNFVSGIAPLSDANSEFDRDRTDGVSAAAYFYHGRHNIETGLDFRKQEYNDLSQQDPRGGFTFTGAATSATGSVASGSGSDLADFLLGVPDTSTIAYGNADKYFREPVYDAYFTDDWRITPILTINAGMRWQYSAPMTELHGRLVNLDIANGFTAAAPVLGSDPVGPVTGNRYPSSLLRPDWREFEPRIGMSWRPIPASTVVVRGGYGIYHDTSVYLRIVNQLSQQAPLSKSLNVQNSAACPLTLADGFTPCSGISSDTFAIDPNFRVGYAQVWYVSVQRDLPFALQITARYEGVKGTHGPQEILPNSYPIGAANPCPDCPSGFAYETSGGNSSRQAGELQLRRRLMNGFAASLMYTYSKSIDDDAYLGGMGHVEASGPGELPSAEPTGNGAIAQNWLDPRAERSLSSFDQRQLVNVQAQYTSGEGLGGGTLMGGWRGRLLKEWTVSTTISAGTGLPETPVYPAAVPGTGFSNTIRPDLTGASIYGAGAGRHVNAAAYSAPAAGQWGTAGRDSITGPGQFTLNSSLQRTFRPHGKLYLDLRIDSTNTLNHPAISSWNTVMGNAQFGLPVGANGMRSLETVLRLRF